MSDCIHPHLKGQFSDQLKKYYCRKISGKLLHLNFKIKINVVTQKYVAVTKSLQVEADNNGNPVDSRMGFYSNFPTAPIQRKLQPQSVDKRNVFKYGVKN